MEIKSLQENIWWKAFAVVFLVKIIVNSLDGVSDDTTSADIMFRILYFIAFLGIIGLALNIKFFGVRIWRIMFGLFSLIFIYSSMLIAIAFMNPIKVSPDVTTPQFLLGIAVFLLDLIILFIFVKGLHLYAYKRDELWGRNQARPE